MTKAEGIYGCQVISAEAGTVDGIPSVQITVQITDGPDKGQRVTYEEVINTQTAKYAGWSMTAVGWKGPNPATLKAEFEKWLAATGGASTVEIKHIEIKKGRAFDKWEAGGCVGPRPVWDKVSGIGRGKPKPMRELGGSAMKDAEDAMRSVMGDMPPQDDVPHAASGGYDPYDDLPEARS